MHNLLLLSLLLTCLTGCFGGSFSVPPSPEFINATSSDFSLFFPYVPNHLFMETFEVENITDYYVHIEYVAQVVNPIGIFVFHVVGNFSF